LEIVSNVWAKGEAVLEADDEEHVVVSAVECGEADILVFLPCLVVCHVVEEEAGGGNAVAVASGLRVFLFQNTFLAFDQFGDDFRVVFFVDELGGDNVFEAAVDGAGGAYDHGRVELVFFAIEEVVYVGRLAGVSAADIEAAGIIGNGIDIERAEGNLGTVGFWHNSIGGVPPPNPTRIKRGKISRILRGQRKIINRQVKRQ